MKLKQTLAMLALVAGATAGMTSCKSQEKKDAEAKVKAEAVAPGITIDVKDGVATLSGTMADDAGRVAAEEAVRKVDGVKSVVNNTTVSAPAPVTINPDEALSAAATAAAKDFSGVRVSVQDGVVTLNGEIKKADLPQLMQAMNAIQPKKVENKLVIQ